MLLQVKKKKTLNCDSLKSQVWCFSEDLFVLFCYVWPFYSLVHSHPQQLCFTVEHLTVKNTELAEVKTEPHQLNKVLC